MCKPVARSLEYFRHQYGAWMLEHAQGLARPHEAASIVEASLAQTGSTALFEEADLEVRGIVLYYLRHFRRTGHSEFMTIPGGQRRDGGAQMAAAIATLAAAGLVPQSMARIAVPAPLFAGLELIRGTLPLRERLACGDSLLELELAGMAQDVSNLRARGQRFTMTLLMIENERIDRDAHAYELEPVRACIATFALHQSVTMRFWPNFVLGAYSGLSRFHVSTEQWHCRRSMLKVKLVTDRGKGNLYCRDMELVQLDEVSIGPAGM